MHELDQEKTTFITHRGIFCYKVMPFKLENVDATYQNMDTKIFESILGKTMDAYINDMVVKSKREIDHIRDLTKVFTILKRPNLRLNKTKCAFRINSGKFLGHLVTRQGIETNPK